jgi:serine/threonine protein kinase
MDFQANSSLFPVGYSSIKNGCIIIFLVLTTITLESHLSQLQAETIKTKIKISKNLIISLQETHEKNIFGFDLRPSTILLDLKMKDFSLAFLNFVGNEEVLKTYPDVSKLVWDSKFAPPELQPRPPSRRRGASRSELIHPLFPTKTSDIYSLGMIIQMILGKTDDTDLIFDDALDRVPSNRLSINNLYQKFKNYSQPILEQLSHVPAIINSSIIDTTPSHEIKSTSFKILKIEGFIPIHWSKDLQDSDYSIIRAEIVIRYPEDFDIPLCK